MRPLAIPCVFAAFVACASPANDRCNTDDDCSSKQICADGRCETGAHTLDVTPDSTEYLAAGTFEFEVPVYNVLTVSVNGGGGGGGGYDGAGSTYSLSVEALDGEASSFSEVIASGGGHGTTCNFSTGHNGLRGVSGGADGGDANSIGAGGAGGFTSWISGQTAGCDPAGGTSTRENQTREATPVMNAETHNVVEIERASSGNGGHGGRATRRYHRGDLPDVVTVIVGRGGAGANVGNFEPYNGYDGEPGSVLISWE